VPTKALLLTEQLINTEKLDLQNIQKNIFNNKSSGILNDFDQTENTIAI